MARSRFGAISAADSASLKKCVDQCLAVVAPHLDTVLRDGSENCSLVGVSSLFVHWLDSALFSFNGSDYSQFQCQYESVLSNPIILLKC